MDLYLLLRRMHNWCAAAYDILNMRVTCRSALPRLRWVQMHIRVLCVGLLAKAAEAWADAGLHVFLGLHGADRRLLEVLACGRLLWGGIHISLLSYFMFHILIIARKYVIRTMNALNRLHSRRTFRPGPRAWLPKLVRLWRWRSRDFVAEAAVGAVFAAVTLLVFAFDDNIILLGVKTYAIKLNNHVIFVL